MLKSYLTSPPFTKFTIIEDSYKTSSRRILQSLIKTHVSNRMLHYFAFEGGGPQNCTIENNPESSVCFYDLSADFFYWMSDRCDHNNIDEVVLSSKNFDQPCFVIIDSLVHTILKYGLRETYQVLNNLVQTSNVQQIITVLHADLLEDYTTVFKYFSHLSTLYIRVQKDHILSYTYKKGPRVSINGVERYYFDDANHFQCKKLEDESVQDLNQFLKVRPEQLSTFKIDLNDQEKISRDKLVLPYLPRASSDTQDQIGNKEGNIMYSFDNVDDWDEEDPDDDLDI